MTRSSTGFISSVVVTHQIADAMPLANRFVVISEGLVVFDGTCDELRDSRELDVLGFLAPFRLSLAQVSKRKFVDY